jgi:hypothetical protein
MKIAVVGDMNPTQQLVIDKMIADGHEIVYIGKDDPYGGIDMDFCIVDEYSEDTSWHAMSVKEVKKPYYRIKERY